MNHTPFTKFFIEADAKMVNFAGFNMPLYISGIVEEHLAVRKNVGIFDVSHMGNILMEGKNAAELLQILTCNDIQKLNCGKVQYTCKTTMPIAKW